MSGRMAQPPGKRSSRGHLSGGGVPCTRISSRTRSQLQASRERDCERQSAPRHRYLSHAVEQHDPEHRPAFGVHVKDIGRRACQASLIFHDMCHLKELCCLCWEQSAHLLAWLQYMPQLKKYSNRRNSAKHTIALKRMRCLLTTLLASCVQRNLKSRAVCHDIQHKETRA